MILEDVSNLSKGSHTKVSICCDFACSEKCEGSYKRVFKDIVRYRSDNNGKDICRACSRRLKASGRNNPNAKYNLDDSFFNVINSEGKAYLLGWIASDGTIHKNGSITISIHSKDRDIFKSFNSILGTDYRVSFRKTKDMVDFRMCSTQMAKDICSHLQIGFGKKSKIVRFPRSIMEDQALGWAFLRGLSDGDGCISNPVRKGKAGYAGPRIGIASSSSGIKQDIAAFTKIPAYVNDKDISWEGNQAIDCMAKMYEKATYSLDRKFELYAQWISWVPGLSGRGNSYKENAFKCVKTRKDAVIPSKVRASDSGYDVTILEKVDSYLDVEVYDTGIKVQPSFGYWLMLTPRSSMSKTGYAFANEIGVIDRSYIGNIKVALRKINKDAPELELPCRIAQLIPTPAIHLGEVIEVDDLGNTTRGDGGFGSSGA